MKSKNCQKVVLKALGHILYGSNFIASDVMYKDMKNSHIQVLCNDICNAYMTKVQVLKAFQNI